MPSRRKFIRQSAALPLLSVLPGELYALGENLQQPIEITGEGEDYWANVRNAYFTHPSLINLNNGGVSPQPRIVAEAFEHYLRICNDVPAYQMWRVLEPGRDQIRMDLAEMLDCSHDEVVINRNTTEALDTIIFGMNLKKGDEIVLSPYDYPNMRNAWEQRRKREGIVLKYVDIELPRDNDETIRAAFASAMNSKTKLVHITHMVNYNGQVLPLKEISDDAAKTGIPVLVDGAHTFAHLDYKLSDYQIDFYGTSLHKWLCAPFGTGLMHIKKDRIKEIWASYPTDALEDSDIRKFEAMGTRSVPAEMAVSQAIRFHQNIGIRRKYDRLKELTDYWTEPFRNEERFISFTPKEDGKYGSLFTFGIEGIQNNEVANYMQKERGIICSPITWRNISGCRISPHVYTSKEDLDKLMDCIHEMIKS